MTFRVSPGLFRTTLTRTIKNNITIVHSFNLARYIYIPCGTKFLREFIFCGLAIFCVLRDYFLRLGQIGFVEGNCFLRFQKVSSTQH